MPETTPSTTDTLVPAPPAPITPSGVQARIDEALKDPVKNREILPELYELRAFEVAAKTAPEILGNAKTIEDAFKSYKHLLGHTTRVSQENAELRKKVEATAAPAQTPSAPPDEPAGGPLQIPIGDPEPDPQPTTFDDAVYRKYHERIVRTGKLEDADRQELSEKYKLGPAVISALESAAKIEAAKAWKRASDIAGGNQRLQELFAWVKQTHAPAQLESLNRGLADPSLSEITLRGLVDKWQKTKPAQPAQKSAEPAPLRAEATGSGVSVQYPAYETNEEYVADTRNPRFRTDPAFQNAVMMRCANTPRFAKSIM